MAVEIDLSGEAAIVTGAGRGLGAAMVRRFAEAGADVVAAARTTEEIEAVVADVEADHGVSGLAVETDLTDVGDIENLVEESVGAFGTPSILVNNAGANRLGDPMEHTIEDVDIMLDVNVRGLFLLTQKWATAYRHSGLDRGRVINVSSIAADLGVTEMTLYAGTKAGVRGITRGFAAALAADGVTVNSISPGLVHVDRTSGIIEEEGDPLDEIDRIPLGRTGTPVDPANVCLFLASDLANYVTGVDVLVDGGVVFTAGLYK